MYVRRNPYLKRDCVCCLSAIAVVYSQLFQSLSIFPSFNLLMETAGPLPKKKRLILCRSRKEKIPPQQRFHLSSPPEVAEAKKGYVPPNTQKSTAWAVNVFEYWPKQRNAKSPSKIIPNDILLTGDNASLCEWLCFLQRS